MKGTKHTTKGSAFFETVKLKVVLRMDYADIVYTYRTKKWKPVWYKQSIKKTSLISNNKNSESGIQYIFQDKMRINRETYICNIELSSGDKKYNETWSVVVRYRVDPGRAINERMVVFLYKPHQNKTPEPSSLHHNLS